MSRRVLMIAALLAVAAGVAAYLRWGTGKGPAEADTEEIGGAGPLLVVHHVRDCHFVDRDLFGQDVGLEGPVPDAAAPLKRRGQSGMLGPRRVGAPEHYCG